MAELVKRDGKTYVRIRDYEKLRELFGLLLSEIQRIKSEGDYEAARDLVERYGVKTTRTCTPKSCNVTGALHPLALQRLYQSGLHPVYNEQKEITDIKVEYGEAYDAQMLRYSRDYATPALLQRIMDIPETIRKIKTELRLAMNGVASAYMRENGMNYKLNFEGWNFLGSRDIAAGFPADHDLAQALWKEDIRECKLLAAMLQPTDTFYPEIADIWVGSDAQYGNRTTYRAELVLPPALRLAESVRMDCLGRRHVQQCGYLILARSVHAGPPPQRTPRPTSFLDQARTALHARPSPYARRRLGLYRNTRHWTTRHTRQGKRFSGKPDSELPKNRTHIILILKKKKINFVRFGKTKLL